MFKIAPIFLIMPRYWIGNQTIEDEIKDEGIVMVLIVFSLSLAGFRKATCAKLIAV